MAAPRQMAMIRIRSDRAGFWAAMTAPWPESPQPSGGQQRREPAAEIPLGHAATEFTVNGELPFGIAHH